ncbi:hypothetical protein MSG28_009139 [Choristoneura fumiferana]|uniref:Uncharacterized protein n=1 Tax=Choristoneura fumiferana TaxID=7141 RepID=A0ACC0KWH3_CHOFU|nr:hypothetical protein MSG28_009139 [Choristoneura fumiferana]
MISKTILFLSCVLLLIIMFERIQNNIVFTFYFKYEVKESEVAEKLLFRDFLIKFNKSYARGEFEMRYQNFKENLIKIERLNSRSRHATYGVTKFSDWTREELAAMLLPKGVGMCEPRFNKTCPRSPNSNMNKKNKDRMTCCKQRGLTSSNITASSDWWKEENTKRLQRKEMCKCRRSRVIRNPKIEKIPHKLDWRERHAVGPILNQRRCAACWAFSIIGVMESRAFIQNYGFNQLSIQELIDCSFDKEKSKTGCHEGRAIVEALGYLCEKKFKVTTESNYPLTTTVDKLNHAVQIVGYDTTANPPYYILRNSWGADWGENGYAKLAIGGNQCVADIVLGFDDVDSYIKRNIPYLGAAVGRSANRIGGASFNIDGVTYNLAKNIGKNHLHGGIVGFDKVNWTTTVDGNKVIFSYLSKDGEEGYPGDLLTNITYELTDDNHFHVDFMSTTTKKTVVNLTNHSYFNLAGHDSVGGTPFDLRTPKRLGDIISKNEMLFDNNFCVTTFDKQGLHYVSRVVHPPSGRYLEVYSDQPGVQLYTSYYLPAPTDPALIGKGGVGYRRHGAFCLETQNYPDAVHHDNFPNPILKPGGIYRHKVIYSFGAEHSDEPMVVPS